MFVPGVWGPYYSVMVPEFWTNEGGQSLAGKLVSVVVVVTDTVVFSFVLHRYQAFQFVCPMYHPAVAVMVMLETSLWF